MHYRYELLLIGIVGVFSFVCSPLGTGAGWCEEADSCKEITAPEVKNILDNKQGLVINALSDIEYEIQHIQGSINIPINTIKSSGNAFPTNKNTTLIFYCMGPK